VGFRIAHLSDIHFGDENAAAVAAAARRLREESFDLVAVSGDLTRFGEVREFEAAAAWLEGLPEPRLVTPGNHDAPYIAWAERLLSPFRRFEAAIGPARAQRFAAPGLLARGVNTARGVQPRLNWSKGRIAPDQTREAVADLGSAGDGALRIVVCHHPLMEMLGEPITAQVRGGTAAARAFAAGGVDLVLSGHIHVPFAWSYPFADGRTHAIGAGTLSTRERGAPAGFNVLDIERAAIRIAALGWTGSRFEPYRTWSVDRRP
jgi:3',5'-cyclic AMP phosphodiesterase CpdA